MRTVNEMRVVFEDWKESGLSQKAFATREGISFTTLQYWRRRLKDMDEAKATSDSKAAKFAPVKVVAAKIAGAERMELRVGENFLLSIPRGIDSDELRRVVSVIREC